MIIFNTILQFGDFLHMLTSIKNSVEYGQDYFLSLIEDHEH